jgi:DNA-binding PadR family transcriptional regulator
MEISSTGYVVLGILNWGARTGYEIKQLVDKSTRFFWAASYGQIYPELKRLERQGLVEGRDDPQGGRRRTIYRLTAKGRRELRRWLEVPAEVFEMRNEALLKLFFSSALPEEAEDHLDSMRANAEEKLTRLREIEPAAKASGGFTYLTLQFGIGMSEWIVEWCEREKRALRRRNAEARRVA